MQVFAPFLPDTDILIFAILFDICRYENQRWVRARQLHNFRGSWILLGEFVDWTRIISLLFAIALLISCGLTFGIQYTVGLLIIVVLTGYIYTLVSTLIMGGDNIIMWLVGTIAIWPIGIWLATKLNWF